ncbi:hypothetical protein BDQ12DRAFT_687721 [Crucibulum laeve]|uniref:Uncharacterized protein n=1 Tax=Crucibulum laeve TaxID=68775 RepID=A0A5C3LTJ6_9AGAR|nr:hypothetical protein BDQ12DRAFT_687721 [Crucibulum laeve]
MKTVPIGDSFTNPSAPSTTSAGVTSYFPPSTQPSQASSRPSDSTDRPSLPPSSAQLSVKAREARLVTPGPPESEYMASTAPLSTAGTTDTASSRAHAQTMMSLTEGPIAEEEVFQHRDGGVARMTELPPPYADRALRGDMA